MSHREIQKIRTNKEKERKRIKAIVEHISTRIYTPGCWELGVPAWLHINCTDFTRIK